MRGTRFSGGLAAAKAGVAHSASSAIRTTGRDTIVAVDRELPNAVRGETVVRFDVAWMYLFEELCKSPARAMHTPDDLMRICWPTCLRSLDYTHELPHNTSVCAFSMASVPQATSTTVAGGAHPVSTTPTGVLPSSAFGSPRPRASSFGSDGPHVHGAGCGHTALRHGDHVGYLDNGVLHCAVDGTMQYETHVIHLDTLLCADSGCTHSNTEAACGAQAPSGSNHGGQRAEAPSGSQSPHHHAVQCAHHRHGPACGHERVPHGNHFDYLVGSELHHPHDDHCDHHGDITVLSLTDIDTSSALGDEADDSSITRSVYAGFAHMQLRRNLARTAMRKAAAARGHSHGGTANTGEHKGEEAQPDALLHASGEKTKWYHDSDLMRFFLMFFLTGGYFLVELIYGMIIGSLALQADAFHMASDLIALVRRATAGGCVCEQTRVNWDDGWVAVHRWWASTLCTHLAGLQPQLRRTDGHVWK